MKKHSLRTLFGVLLLSGGVIAYNYWALSSGRCTLATFFSLSPLAVVLILCNLVALVVLAAIRHKSRRDDDRVCSCGNILHLTWHYCPGCGDAGRQDGSA